MSGAVFLVFVWRSLGFDLAVSRFFFWGGGGGGEELCTLEAHPEAMQA